MWELADFGLTSEGTVKRVHTTSNRRGTPSYRAPELLGANPIYNNKVDIWSIGCILYELCRCRKAFCDGFAVLHYQNNVQLAIKLDGTFSEDDNKNISRRIKLILQVERQQRSYASHFLTLFSRWCQFQERNNNAIFEQKSGFDHDGISDVSSDSESQRMTEINSSECNMEITNDIDSASIAPKPSVKYIRRRLRIRKNE